MVRFDDRSVLKKKKKLLWKINKLFLNDLVEVCLSSHGGVLSIRMHKH